MFAAEEVLVVRHLSSYFVLGIGISFCMAAAVLYSSTRAIGSKVGTKPNRSFNVRIAVITPSQYRAYYVQPLLRDLARIFPGMVLLVGEFPGFLPTCRDSFGVKVLPGMRNFVNEGEVYFRWLPLSLIGELRRARPDIMILGQFSMWTFYAVLYKLFHRCRILFLWDGTVPSCAYTHSPLRLLWRRMLGRFVDAAISNTHEGVQYLSEVIHIPRSKIRHGIHLVADLDSLCCECRTEKSAEPPARRPVFLYVGSLSKRKGVRFLLEAVKELKQQGRTGFSVILVGEGEQQQLRSTISGELEQIVQIIGPVSYTQLGRYYRNCDAFILPCREDVWGMVVSEAMVFGKAILCSKYANAKELVQHEVNGFIFDPLSPTELSSYMAQIIDNPHLCTQFGHVSRTIVSRYTPASAAALLAEVIAELLPFASDGAYARGASFGQ
jgi:glycosyltransferase involved in cell wall biosynthesis